ncbi:unnamed protein product [Durusdinium trenchii]|uniref:Uncharacterized protein n=1 Tax=Durusdinium trenchii TaxID=1381693 RepID=A0ABP0P739_9DINO
MFSLPQYFAMLCLTLSKAAVAESLWDGETQDFWELCKSCTSNRRVFCFTTGTCLDLDIDAPSEALWSACMNPLLIPDSCRTKGIHPPGTSREAKAGKTHRPGQSLEKAWTRPKRGHTDPDGHGVAKQTQTRAGHIRARRRRKDKAWTRRRRKG